MYGLNKYMIDINIETLSGTQFSLKVSPLEPVHSVKAKIQRLEGIPISHQHLVWKTTELEDNCCLNDYNIPNGATIKMVLALRGGPINTRRMTTEDSLLRDVSDLMEIREDSNLWNNNDSSQSMNKHVTLLLFRDGDHLNLLRVIDRGDAASPISGAMSAASMYVPYDETDHERAATNNREEGTSANLIENDLSKISKLSKQKSSKRSLTNENEKTREKMMALRDKMNEYKKSKVKKQSNEQINKHKIAENKISEETTANIQLVAPQPPPRSASKQKPQINNLRMKRFQIIGDSKPNEVITTKKTSQSNESKTEAIQNEANSSEKSNYKTKNSNHSKTKLTTIYTTTDRNGQVFIKKIHENYTEYDIEDDEEGVDHEEDDPDEEVDSEDGMEDEDEENYDEECPDYETNLLKNYNCYYDDEYFVDDNEADYDDVDVDDDDEENDEDDDIDDDIDEEDDERDDDDIDDDIDEDDEEETKNTKNKTESEFENTENTTVYGDEETYDDDENELLMNKSELLIAEDRQTNNSPNSGGANECNNSSDLMQMMMMMTLNSDQLSLNGATSGVGIGGGISSSLATTALPTILTPLYTTDNENFVIPPTRSAMKKIKNIRISNKKTQNYQPKPKVRKNKSEILDVIQIEAKNPIMTDKEQLLNDTERLKQIENIIQEEINRPMQKQKRRKRKIQLQIQHLKEQNELSTNNEAGDKEADKESDEQDDKSTQRRNSRRRRRREFNQEQKSNISFSSILLLPEEIENIKKRVKEGIEIKQNRQFHNQTTLKIISDQDSKAEISEQAKTKDEIENNEQNKPIISTAMPSSLQKRVSFIVTPTDEDRKAIETEAANRNVSLIENNYYNHDKIKKILKTSQNSPSKNSLQAKVYRNDDNGTQIKPLLLTNYKQKPPPKLDSLYSSNEIVTFSNANKQYYSNQQDIYNKSYNSPSSNEITNNNENRIQPQNNILIKRNSAVMRNVATPTSSPTTINRLETLKTNSSYPSNSVLKNYSNQLTYNSRINNKPNESTSIEPLRLYSASSKTNKSVSSNDLSQSKSLKLPPVINSNNNSNNIIIGGSTNNLTSMGLSETTTKKKITDLSRYCYFCQRKTGLASSYICRCGNNYCTQHRNAEAHNCTYDYKTEGRKLIEHSNPLVAAPKLPKI